MKRFVAISVLIFSMALVLPACEAIQDAVDEWTEDDDWEEDSAGGNGGIVDDYEDEGEIEPSSDESDDVRPTSEQIESGVINNKWDLWSSGATMLRGANIWQAIVILELDGPDFKGSGPVGPPYSQGDFNRLAELGGNYVTISGPGLFTESPPFTVDLEVVEYLDELLEKITNADMFASIGFRTGPGRSEFTLCCGDDPYFDGYFNDSVWEEQAAQDAWVEMWRYTAERYRDHPAVVGYKLMIEPNAAPIFFDIYEPEDFYPEYSGTLYDWNQFFPRLVSGIREVDAETPILVNAEGFSAIAWLPYLEMVDETRIVYIAHQYHPFEEYTHQEPHGRNSYPDRFDLDYDGSPDDFNRAWLVDFLSGVNEFSVSHGVPVGIDEFGVNRWVPQGAVYMDDLMGLFEQMGINYSLWEWSTSWPDFEQDVHDMNYLFGDDPDNRSYTESDLLDVIRGYWSLNSVRPSNVPWR